MDRNTIRILIVDDHPIVRRGLKAEISYCDDMCVVAEAENGADAVKLALLLNPMLILMDLVLPEMGGVEAIRKIIAQRPDTRILVLSSFFDDDRVYAALEAGASGYILKECPPEDILVAIRKVAHGESILNPKLIHCLMREVRSRSNLSDSGLTDRELEIMAWVAKGVPNKQIACQVGISQATVRAHVSNVLSKLGLENRSQIVLYAVQNGVTEMAQRECMA